MSTLIPVAWKPGWIRQFFRDPTVQMQRLPMAPQELFGMGLTQLVVPDLDPVHHRVEGTSRPRVLQLVSNGTTYAMLSHAVPDAHDRRDEVCHGVRFSIITRADLPFLTVAAPPTPAEHHAFYVDAIAWCVGQFNRLATDKSESWRTQMLAIANPLEATRAIREQLAATLASADQPSAAHRHLTERLALETAAIARRDAILAGADAHAVLARVVADLNQATVEP